MPIWESQNKPKHIHIRVTRIQGLLPSCKTFRKKSCAIQARSFLEAGSQAGLEGLKCFRGGY